MFGKIENGKMVLNESGQIVFNEWMKLPERFPNIKMDVFQIMPNHIHGIIKLNENPAGAALAAAPNMIIQNNNDPEIQAGASPARTTIPGIIGAYKSLVANECLKRFKSKNEIMGKIWHRNYYDQIIRSDRSYYNIPEYIKNNPVNWCGDKYGEAAF